MSTGLQEFGVLNRLKNFIAFLVTRLCGVAKLAGCPGARFPLNLGFGLRWRSHSAEAAAEPDDFDEELAASDMQWEGGPVYEL
jgi:hypothetical protein